MFYNGQMHPKSKYDFFHNPIELDIQSETTLSLNSPVKLSKEPTFKPTAFQSTNQWNKLRDFFLVIGDPYKQNIKKQNQGDIYIDRRAYFYMIAIHMNLIQSVYSSGTRTVAIEGYRLADTICNLLAPDEIGWKVNNMALNDKIGVVNISLTNKRIYEVLNILKDYGNYYQQGKPIILTRVAEEKLKIVNSTYLLVNYIHSYILQKYPMECQIIEKEFSLIKSCLEPIELISSILFDDESIQYKESIELSNNESENTKLLQSNVYYTTNRKLAIISNVSKEKSNFSSNQELLSTYINDSITLLNYIKADKRIFFIDHLATPIDVNYMDEVSFQWIHMKLLMYLIYLIEW